MRQGLRQGWPRIAARVAAILQLSCGKNSGSAGIAAGVWGVGVGLEGEEGGGCPGKSCNQGWLHYFSGLEAPRRR